MSLIVNNENEILIRLSGSFIEYQEKRKALLELLSATQGIECLREGTVFHATQLLEDMMPSSEVIKKGLTQLNTTS